MRLLSALAALSLVAVAGAAQAETWTSYAELSNGAQWFYDADYAYKDQASGRVVVMQAIGKPSSKIGPSGPGKPDGVGSVVAIDCKEKNLILMGSYKPQQDLTLAEGWRKDTPKKLSSDEDKKLVAAVCAKASQLAVK